MLKFKTKNLSKALYTEPCNSSGCCSGKNLFQRRKGATGENLMQNVQDKDLTLSPAIFINPCISQCFPDKVIFFLACLWPPPFFSFQHVRELWCVCVCMECVCMCVSVSLCVWVCVWISWCQYVCSPMKFILFFARFSVFCFSHFVIMKSYVIYIQKTSSGQSGYCAITHIY